MSPDPVAVGTHNFAFGYLFQKFDSAKFARLTYIVYLEAVNMIEIHANHWKSFSAIQARSIPRLVLYLRQLLHLFAMGAAAIDSLLFLPLRVILPPFVLPLLPFFCLPHACVYMPYGICVSSVFWF